MRTGLMLGAVAGVAMAVSAFRPGLPPSAPGPEAPARRVTLRFAAVVGTRPFACGQSYDSVGRSHSRITPTDFRFFVQSVRLVDAGGREVPLQLDADGRWQQPKVALLDFEDGTGPCRNGTPATRLTITGRVPAGEYRGLRFSVGVPWELNHLDLARQAAPLDLTAMFWTWASGYTFLRLDLSTDGPLNRLFLHLGSSGCVREDGDTDAKLPPDRCAQPNRPDVAIEGFDPARDTVLVDLAALLAESRLDTNQANTAKGCMSGPDDLDCDPMFAALGLPFGDRSGGPQRVFRRAGPGPVVGQYRAPAGPFRWQLPAGFPEPRVPADNPMSVPKVELGRHLFYDRRLSGDLSMSCATCHQQASGFNDPRPHPTGITGEVHPRSSMGLANVAYSPALTWANPKLERLEQQALVPMFGEDPVELGLAGREGELLARLGAEPRYRVLFPAAFPGERQPLTLANVVKAIAAFERTLIAGDSPYDQARAGQPGRLSAAARRGEQLFLGERLECFHCHGGFLFTGTVDYAGKATPEVEFHNTGLYNVGGTGAYPAPNTGLLAVTGLPDDMGRFKAPGLRNVAVSAPYMHDGSIATLDEVVAHYQVGGRRIAEGPDAGDGAENPYKSQFVAGFHLTPEERGDLVAFLESLTDSTFLTDPRLANPWPAGSGGNP